MALRATRVAALQTSRCLLNQLQVREATAALTPARAPRHVYMPGTGEPTEGGGSTTDRGLTDSRTSLDGHISVVPVNQIILPDEQAAEVIAMRKERYRKKVEAAPNPVSALSNATDAAQDIEHVDFDGGQLYKLNSHYKNSPAVRMTLNPPNGMIGEPLGVINEPRFDLVIPRQGWWHETLDKYGFGDPCPNIPESSRIPDQPKDRFVGGRLASVLVMFWCMLITWHRSDLENRIEKKQRFLEMAELELREMRAFLAAADAQRAGMEPPTPWYAGRERSDADYLNALL